MIEQYFFMLSSIYFFVFLINISLKYSCISLDNFSKSFEGILDAAKIGDINWFIDSANDISLQFGKQPVIKDTMDFLQKMESDETIII